MSLLVLNSPKESLLSESAFVGRTASFHEMVHMSYRNQVTNFNSDSSASVRREVKSENEKMYEHLTGQPLSMSWANDRRAIRNSLVRSELEDEAINKLKEENPARYSVLKTTDEIEAEAKSRATREQAQFQEAWEYTPGFGKYVAGFAGGAAGVLTDPIQWPALAVGSSYAVGSSVLRNFAIEAGAGALSEFIAQPSIMQWQEELGNNYGIKDASVNVLFGAAAGGLISLPLSAYSRVANKNALAMRDIVDKLEASDRVKAAVDSLADVAEHNAGSPSPDLVRHDSNAELVNSATAQGRMVELDELDTRITDDIDGLPSEAFDFLNPDAEFRITTKTTFDAKGKTTQPIVTETTKKMSQMTKPQIRQVVEKDLLPKILVQMRDDYANVARRLGKAQDTKIQTEVYKINKELSEIQNQLKDAKQNVRFRREKLLSRAETPGQKNLIKEQAKTETNKLNQEYNKRKIELESEKLGLEQKRITLGLQKNRKEVMKQLAKGIVPAGDDYVSHSVRKTIDKVVDAATASKKIKKSKLDSVEQTMKETGLIKEKPRSYDEVIQELDAAEKILDEEVGFQMAKLDESDLDESIFDSDGKVTTLRKIMEDVGVTKDEIVAMRTCATGGAA